MNYNAIKTENNNGIAIIRLNRPERMNAVSEEMYLEIQQALNKIEADDNISSVIITGSIKIKDGKEKQAFCAGADLKKHSTGERTHFDKRKYIELAHTTTKMIYDFPKPVIAALNGPARGAGSEIAFNCDFIIMADDASIAFPEIGLGTFVGGGVTSTLPKIIGIMKAKELIYTGKVLNGKEAVDLGIALTSHPIDLFFDEVKNFAATLSEKAPISIKMAKERLQNSVNLNMDTVLKLETDSILSCMDTEDWAEGIKAFNEKRKPKYRGK